MRSFLIAFCFSLLALLLIINPVLLLNDEWITTNQLSQLSEHKQILFNEGKYGLLEDGTLHPYFVKRENILPYTSYLPLISYPSHIIIQYIGNCFPYYTSVLFSLLLLILSFLLLNPIRKKILSYLCIGLAFVSLFLNITLYRPFYITGTSTITGTLYHTEILGIVTSHIWIFLLFVMILFLVMRTLFPDSDYVSFGILSVVACSSYLFWTISCKDHIDVIFAYTVLVLFLIRFTKTSDIWYLFSAFVVTGLLTWIRPELGTILFITLLLITVHHTITTCNLNRIKPYIFHFFAAIGTGIGMIPLFISNFFVTGNPITFPFMLISTGPYSSIEKSSIPEEMGVSNNISNIYGLSEIPDFVSSIFELITTRISPGVPIDTLFSNLYAVFVSPTTLKIPIFALVPLFILGLFFLPIWIDRNKRKETKIEKIILFYLLILILGTICAYLTSIGGLHTSYGIYPDIRYLSPIYLPLTLIGIILLRSVLNDMRMVQRMIRSILIITIVSSCCMPFVLNMLLMQYDFWDILLWTNGIVTTVIYCLLLFNSILAFYWYKGRINQLFFLVPLSFLIALPLIWQIVMIMLVNSCVGDADFYPPFLPMIRELFVWLHG